MIQGYPYSISGNPHFSQAQVVVLTFTFQTRALYRALVRTARPQERDRHECGPDCNYRVAHLSALGLWILAAVFFFLQRFILQLFWEWWPCPSFQHLWTVMTVIMSRFCNVVQTPLEKIETLKHESFRGSTLYKQQVRILRSSSDIANID